METRFEKRKALSTENRDRAARLLRVWNENKAALGLTQEKAARILGCTQPTVAQYLHGIIPLNTDAAIKFAGILGKTIDDIWPDMADKLSVLGPVGAVVEDAESTQLSRDEYDVVVWFRGLQDHQRKTLLDLVHPLADGNSRRP